MRQRRAYRKHLHMTWRVSSKVTHHSLHCAAHDEVDNCRMSGIQRHLILTV